MTNPAILVYSPVAGEAATYTKLLRNAVPETMLFEATSPVEISAATEHADILLGWKFPKGMIGSMPRLRWVHKISAGVEDVVADLARNPALMISRTDGSAIAPRMVEYVLGAIFSTTQQFRRAWAQARDKAWQPYLVGRASGKTVGVAGLGDIGKRIALALNLNGMRVVGWRRSEAPLPEGVERVFRGNDQLHEFVSICDFVVSVLPTTDDTRNIFDHSVFSAMKSDAVFINVGRGHSVDEEALADALSQARIGSAVLDVFQNEPLPSDSPLWDLENIMVTPHVSGPLLPEDVISSFLENLHRFRASEPLHKLVDVGRGY